jgi:hypothetical protein
VSVTHIPGKFDGEITIQGYTAHHHVYVVPGVVDGDVVQAQAINNLNKRQETTVVHHHAKHVKGEGYTEVECLGHHHDTIRLPKA